jgi:peptidyl-tRNA hydrolase
MSQKVLQYVVMRRDLLAAKKGGFSTGANVSQACHAVTAAIHRSQTAGYTNQFLNDTENMTVCVLCVDSQNELEELAESLSKNSIAHHLWIEKPELIPTALATAPLPKEIAAPYFSHLKLLR